MKKLLIALLMITVTFSAFAGGEKEGSAEKEGSVEKKEPLTFLTGSTGIRLDDEMVILNKYTEETGQEFEVITVPYSDLDKKISAMIRGGEAPDLVRGTEGHSVKFRDHFVPLDYDDSTLIPRIFYNSAGEKISLPVEITAVGCFINVELAEKYGVNYPKPGEETWTWDEFEVEMRKMLGQSDVDFPAAIDGSGHRFSPWIYQHGGLLYGGSFKDLGSDGAGAIAALERLCRLADEGIFDPQTYAVGTYGDALFSTGRYGIHFSGSWKIGTYAKELGFNFTVVPMPSGKGGAATVLGGSSYHASKDTGREDDAVAFINWIATPKNLAWMGEVTRQLMATTTEDIDYGELQPYFDGFSGMLAATSGEYIDDFAEYIKIPGAFSHGKNSIIEALGDLKTPEQALKDAAISLQEAAAEAGL
jgi:alpha-1,4-digalacturonate transport system substrate-binding protein